MAPARQFTGQELMEDGTKSALEHANYLWKTEAMACVEELCTSKETFTSDDVWGMLEPTGMDTSNHSAMGSILRLASKNGLCTNTRMTVPTKRPEGHCRAIPIWRSCYYSPVPSLHEPRI